MLSSTLPSDPSAPRHRLGDGSGPPTMADTPAGVMRPHASKAGATRRPPSKPWRSLRCGRRFCMTRPRGRGNEDCPGAGRQPARAVRTIAEYRHHEPALGQTASSDRALVCAVRVTRGPGHSSVPSCPIRASATEHHAIDAVGSIACHDDEGRRPVLLAAGHIVERRGHHRLAGPKADRGQRRSPCRRSS